MAADCGKQGRGTEMPRAPPAVRGGRMRRPRFIRLSA